MTRLEAIMDGVLEREGGFVDNPADPGGATNFGITARTLGQWRGFKRNATVDEVKALKAEEALQIYRDRYVVEPGFGNFSDRPLLQETLVDVAVNSGPSKAIKLLQRALEIPDDGILGPLTVNAARAQPEQRIAVRVCTERLRFLGRLISKNLDDHDQDGIPDNTEFASGWLNRTASLIEGLV